MRKEKDMTVDILYWAILLAGWIIMIRVFWNIFSFQQGAISSIVFWGIAYTIKAYVDEKTRKIK